MTIPTENPWNSSHLEHPREPREIVEAGPRRKCHIIDLSECSRIAGCRVPLYVGREHAGQTVCVTFDPQLRAWVVADDQGRLLRQLDAPEISRANIIGLTVSHKRD